MQNDLPYVGQSQVEPLPNVLCYGVKNRVPASIRCMIQFAQQMDADAKREERSIKGAVVSKGGSSKENAQKLQLAGDCEGIKEDDSTTMSTRPEVSTRGPGSGGCWTTRKAKCSSWSNVSAN
jgi:hypothetical protein